MPCQIYVFEIVKVLWDCILGGVRYQDQKNRIENTVVCYEE